MQRIFEVLGVSATHDPASLFGPQGDIVQGVAEIRKANEVTVSHFAVGSKNKFRHADKLDEQER